MKLHAIALAVALAISGCSSLNPASAVVGALTEKPMLAVDTQVGERTQTLGTNSNDKIDVSDTEGPVTVTSNKVKQSIQQAEKVIIQEDVPMWVWLLCIIGWMLPSPGEIYREIKSWFAGFFSLFKRHPKTENGQVSDFIKK